MHYKWKPHENEIREKIPTRYRDNDEFFPVGLEPYSSFQQLREDDPEFNIYCPLSRLHEYYIIDIPELDEPFDRFESNADTQLYYRGPSKAKHSKHSREPETGIILVRRTKKKVKKLPKKSSESSKQSQLTTSDTQPHPSTSGSQPQPSSSGTEPLPSTSTTQTQPSSSSTLPQPSTSDTQYEPQPFDSGTQFTSAGPLSKPPQNQVTSTTDTHLQPISDNILERTSSSSESEDERKIRQLTDPTKTFSSSEQRQSTSDESKSYDSKTIESITNDSINSQEETSPKTLASDEAEDTTNPEGTPMPEEGPMLEGTPKSEAPSESEEESDSEGESKPEEESKIEEAFKPEESPAKQMSSPKVPMSTDAKSKIKQVRNRRVEFLHKIIQNSSPTSGDDAENDPNTNDPSDMNKDEESQQLIGLPTRRYLLKRLKELNPINPLDWTPHLLRIIIGLAFGLYEVGFQSSIMTVVWNIEDRFYEDWWWYYVNPRANRVTLIWNKHLFHASLQFVFALGAIVGSYKCRTYVSTYGVLRTIMMAAFHASIAHMFMCCTDLLRMMTLLYLGRFFIGWYCGIVTALTPIYLLEVTRHDMRAKCFSFLGVGYALGFLAATIAGHPILLGRQAMVDTCVSVSIPAFWIAFLCLWWYPLIGPRQLYIKDGRIIPAIHIFETLVHRRLKVEELVMECKREVNYAIASALQVGPCQTYENVLAAPGLERPLAVGIKIQAVVQIAFYNVFMATSSKVLLARGYSYLVMGPRTMIFAAMCMVFWTLVGLKLIRVCKRRQLFLAGLFGMALALTCATIALFFIHDLAYLEFYYDICLMILMAAFAVGPLLIPSLYLVEMFTQDCRYTSVCFCVTCGWVIYFLLMLVYPLADGLLGAFVHVPGLLGSLWSIYFVYHEIIETTDMSLINITDHYRPTKYDADINLYSVAGARQVIQRLNLDHNTERWELFMDEQDTDQFRSCLLMEEFNGQRRAHRIARGFPEEEFDLPEIRIYQATDLSYTSDEQSMTVSQI